MREKGKYLTIHRRTPVGSEQYSGKGEIENFSTHPGLGRVSDEVQSVHLKSTISVVRPVMNGAQRYYQNSPTHARTPTHFLLPESISAPLQTPQSQGLLRPNTHLGNPPMPYDTGGKQVFFKDNLFIVLGN